MFTCFVCLQPASFFILPCGYYLLLNIGSTLATEGKSKAVDHSELSSQTPKCSF